MFNKEIWIKSASHLKNTKYLALMAIFIALRVVVASMFIPVADNLRIGISFLVASVEGAIIGPAAGLLSGALADLIGFMLFPSGPFFFGYTLSAMCSSMVWGMFLYEQKISVLRLGAAKAVINYFVNVLMGSLWSAMMYSKGFIYYATNSLIKNTVLLPLEIIALVLVFSVMIPILKHRNLIRGDNTVPIPWK
jgi:ECF transporter S component (folate family)